MSVFDLKSNQELRLQVGDESIILELRRGLAEIHGTEMLINKNYSLRKNSKVAVFTYQGATIEVTGTPLKCHVGQKCDYMKQYLKIHGDLERMRVESEQTIDPDLSKTPICLICKPLYARNVGKSTLCKILLNYATRRGRAPILVDLDPDQGQIGIPGTIGALSIESPIDIETGLQLRSSMLMHFGHTSPSADSDSKSGLVYRVLIENLAKIVHSKLEQDRKSYNSGVIINSSSWTDDTDYKLLVHACKAFKANVVLVMDDEVLQDDLQKDLSDVRVLNVPKTVGIMARANESTVELRYLRIKEYFYGTVTESYSPMTSEIKFSILKRLIYRIGNPLMLPDALMPLGTTTRENQIKVSQYDCSASDLLHHILAVSYCRIDDILEDQEVVLRTNIMGFICITSSKNDGEVVSILTPQKLPNPMDHVLLYSDVQYMDSLI